MHTTQTLFNIKARQCANTGEPDGWNMLVAQQQNRFKRSCVTFFYETKHGQITARRQPLGFHN